MTHPLGISAKWVPKKKVRLVRRNLLPSSHFFPHLLRVFDPLDLLPVGGDVLEGLGVVDGEDEKESLPRPHVLVPHGRVLLLSGRVKDVQEARLPVDHHLLAVRVLDGGVVLVHEVVLDQLDGQGGLAHAAGWKGKERGQRAVWRPEVTQ